MSAMNTGFAQTTGLCGCGCGQTTRLAPVTDRSKGWVKGRPLRFALGHNLRGRSGERSPHWKGGRYLSTDGYVLLTVAPGVQKYEHIVVAERAIGRPLKNLGRGHPKTEVVHHIDGNKQNNANTNLLVCTHEYHTALHHRLERSPIWPQFKPVVRGRKARKTS